MEMEKLYSGVDWRGSCLLSVVNEISLYKFLFFDEQTDRPEIFQEATVFEKLVGFDEDAFDPLATTHRSIITLRVGTNTSLVLEQLEQLGVEFEDGAVIAHTIRATIPHELLNDVAMDIDVRTVSITLNDPTSSQLDGAPTIPVLGPPIPIYDGDNAFFMTPTLSLVDTTARLRHGVPSYLNGENQIIGVMDQRIMASHCMFTDGVLDDAIVDTVQRCVVVNGAWRCGVSTVQKNLHRSFVRISDGCFGQAQQPSYHATHVSGIITGDSIGDAGGDTGLYHGLAVNSRISALTIFGNGGSYCRTSLVAKLLEMYSDGARISSNSYNYNSFYKAGSTVLYYVDEAEIDSFIFTNPEMLVIFSTGNAGSSTQHPARAKNIISVGALDCKSEDKMPWWSSHGPIETVDGGRISPTLVACGVDVVSATTSETSTCSMASLSGTSMACPAISGLASLARQYVQQKFQIQSPLATSLRAVLIASARGANTLVGHNTAIFPHSNDAGFGMPRLETVVGDGKTAFLKELHVSPQQSGPIFESVFTVDGPGGVVCTVLSFIDRPSVVGTMPSLWANVDLRVQLGSGEEFLLYHGNGGDSPDLANLDERVCLLASANETLRVIAEIPHAVNNPIFASVFISSDNKLTIDYQASIKNIRAAVNVSSCCDPDQPCSVQLENGVQVDGERLRSVHERCCDGACEDDDVVNVPVPIPQNVPV